ncbi:FAD-dependent oxidoreductase [Leptolyngbya sp. 15MV]|nr:FAD-dependent oxidoreductase [Leptolyngbya sp. 15MV]
MRMTATPVVKDVVLVGAGHAHVAVLRNFGMKPLPGVRLTLITREVDTPYSGMLPGHVAGHYTADEIHIDTGPLARLAGARLYQDEAIGLDVANRRVICRDRPPVPYDLVSLDIGSRPNTADVPGAAEHALPVKPIDGFLPRFAVLHARVLEGRSRHILSRAKVHPEQEAVGIPADAPGVVKSDPLDEGELVERVGLDDQGITWGEKLQRPIKLQLGRVGAARAPADGNVALGHDGLGGREPGRGGQGEQTDSRADLHLVLSCFDFRETGTKHPTLGVSCSSIAPTTMNIQRYGVGCRRPFKPREVGLWKG